MPLGCVRCIKSRCRKDIEVYEYRNLWNQKEKFRVTYENLRDEDGTSDWYLTLVEPK